LIVFIVEIIIYVSLFLYCMKKRGRPIGSEIRQNVVEVLYFLGEGYAYDIYKVYAEVFPKVTMRSVYYQLKQGEKLGIFSVSKIKKHEGDYSWGGYAERVYYKLSDLAIPVGNVLVREYLNRKRVV